LYSRFDVGLSSTSQRASVDSNSGPLGPNVPAPADEADEASDDDDGPAVTAPAPTPSTTPPTTAPPPDGDVATRYSLVYDEPPTDGGPFELTLTVGNTGSEPITISPADLALEVDGQPLAPSQPTPGPITVAPDAFAAVPVSFAVPAGAERFELVISTGDERTSDRITVAL
ncbi:MAG: hypothetical protein S0880_06740, partial [Actinomycetota bacterium]|nr:hypothetical protein [Actinomycetota bacterium]